MLHGVIDCHLVTLSPCHLPNPPDSGTSSRRRCLTTKRIQSSLTQTGTNRCPCIEFSAWLSESSYLAVSRSWQAPTKEQEEVAKNIKKLKTSKDAKGKVEALKELGRLGAIQVLLTRPIVPEIVRMLDDKDGSVRGEAAHTLGRSNPKTRKRSLKRWPRWSRKKKKKRFE